MKRFTKKFKSNDISFFKQKLLSWSDSFSTSIFLNSNNYINKLGDYECICACEVHSKIPFTVSNSIEKLDNYIDQTRDWIFGYLNYDLKNEIENLKSKNRDNFNLPNLFFFQPRKIWIIRKDQIEALYINKEEIEKDWININDFSVESENKTFNSPVMRSTLSKEQYLSKINTIKEHIFLGDIYEVNFCFEWFCEKAKIDPVKVYRNLNSISKSPMSALFKFNELSLVSSSPERYLKKKHNRLISQPIKGTERRDKDSKVDKNLMINLGLNKKERSENIMIVDLVRNDMSRFSKPGSVDVKELCEVYPFKQVYQMISTIESEIDQNLNFGKIISSTFPMGSMTGAPKIKAMKIIDDFEVTKRGLYSGAVGFIDPEKNFDFNVVIRSLIYNSKLDYLSFHVGSAITAKSTPLDEYNECLLKGEAMILSLN